MENKNLRRVYYLLSVEQTRAHLKIDGIDRAIENCDRLNREFLYGKRAEAVAYLNGIHKAKDIVWKEINR